MLQTTLAALLVSAGLAGSALAQNAASPSGSFLTQQGPTEFRASKFVGLEVYGSNNEKIGDVREILISTDGQAKGAVLGVSGFLGIGEKNVAIAWNALTWSNDRPVARSAATGSPATTGSTTAPPATAGVPAAGPNRNPAEQAAYNGYPDHATVQLTKADLQNAPAFKYYAETHSASGAASSAAPPARP